MACDKRLSDCQDDECPIGFDWICTRCGELSTSINDISLDVRLCPRCGEIDSWEKKKRERKDVIVKLDPWKERALAAEAKVERVRDAVKNAREHYGGITGQTFPGDEEEEVHHLIALVAKDHALLLCHIIDRMLGDER